jgi:sugar O-acyltransferase (sialic acid O-acetyltransferase NeuD family)
VGSGLILVAASGLALEAAEAARAAGLDVEGCVDDNPDLTGTLAGGWLRVLGGLDIAVAQADSPLLICAGRGVSRRRIHQRLAAAGVDEGRYASLVHPSVQVPDSCAVGAGSILLAGVVLTASVSVGQHVVAMPQVTLTHDDSIDDYATLCAAVTLGGNVRVGSAAYLGMASSVRERVTVGAEATLGMGAVLTRDLPPGETWAGVPARPLGAPGADVSASVTSH